MKATVDKQACAGTGLCQETCPQVFQVVDGVSKVQVDGVPPDLENACREAADNCPTGAISIDG